MNKMNKPIFDKLVKAYKKAVKENKDSFEFEGALLMVCYAKYLIEYLTPKYDYA